MSRNSGVTRSGDLDSLPSWISDHLGQGSSYMADEVSQSPSSPVEGSPEENPLIAIHPSVEEKTNIMTIEELNALRETYFFPPEARNKKVLLGGYPSNVKGWKSKFFFVSGDEWEIPAGTSPVGAPRVPRTWGIPDKHCNNPPRLFGDEMKVFDEAFQSVEKSGRFSVPVLLESKSFGQVFGSPESRTSRTAGANLPSGEASSSSSDVGESENPHDQARRESPSRDDSIECLGSIRTNFRRLLPHIPYLTLLRWLGGRLARSSGRLRVRAREPPTPAKEVVIGEKRAGESITSSPSKKAKADDGSKGKGVDIGPEGKKKASSLSKTLAAPTVVPSRPGEGTSAHHGAVPGPAPSILDSPSVAERLLRGVIPPTDKEKVDKLTLDQTATKLFHVIGQALVLGSSLAVRNREAREQASLQEGRVASMKTEVARLQKLAADFEQQLAESRAREQQANDELAKAKSDRDLLSDQCGRSGVLVNELREALNKSKDSAVEEFKSLLEFMVAVEDAAFKYFGEGFNFCKVQLRRHHPDPRHRPGRNCGRSRFAGGARRG
ncbi:hypothetical protein Acr_08g0008190 [Actinidia rufa]|uniref:Uncharacterized protein n=1 Tax=Actinidia rufa TaxID=165716 RepID=A0A7J0F1C9_9ERIC|nr:hypothetical protein Acr_08g0008190 [Actinidia rufa]